MIKKLHRHEISILHIITDFIINSNLLLRPHKMINDMVQLSKSTIYI